FLTPQTTSLGHGRAWNVCRNLDCRTEDSGVRTEFPITAMTPSRPSDWRRRLACRASEAGRSGGRHAGPGRVSKFAESLHEEMLRRSGRPRLPGRKPVPRKRIVEERVDLDAERLDHVGSAPADDVERLGGSGQTIGPFVLGVVLGG